MIHTFSSETRRLIEQGQHGVCHLCLNPIRDFHHKIPNTKTNRKLFPKFIQSIFNAVGLCRGCHVNRIKDPAVRLSLDMARAYEEWLQDGHIFEPKEEFNG